MNHPIHCTPTRPIRVRRRATRRALSGSLPLRSGVTTVEFAMTAPLLFMLLYAALELGHANMTFNAVEAACYEGARVGIVPGAKASECQAATERILAISKIRGANVTVTPSNLNTSTPSVQVRVTVPYAQTAIIPPTFTRLLTINRQCELVREQL
ncbi:MAG: pilus assembly protein [Pirellulaceae bacterium]|jgi:Flp pilus assembly protein TadG|nr:pilus assembly protein [Pirellulaceae bacterium]